MRHSTKDTEQGLQRSSAGCRPFHRLLHDRTKTSRPPQPQQLVLHLNQYPNAGFVSPWRSLAEDHATAMKTSSRTKTKMDQGCLKDYGKQWSHITRYYQNNGFNMMNTWFNTPQACFLGTERMVGRNFCFTRHVFSRADLLTGLIESCQAFHWPSINDTYPLVIKHGMLENIGKRSVYKSNINNIIQLKASEKLNWDFPTMFDYERLIHDKIIHSWIVPITFHHSARVAAGNWDWNSPETFFRPWWCSRWNFRHSQKTMKKKQDQTSLWWAGCSVFFLLHSEFFRFSQMF